MANGFERARPGQVISSAWINSFVDFVEGKLDEGEGPTGTQTVPDLFGLFLAQARVRLTQSSVNLQVGRVLDAFGTIIDINATDAQARRVLSQARPPGSRAPLGASVDLLVAAVAGTGPSPQPAPTIDHFENLARTRIESTPIGEQVFVVGSNFATEISSNSVFFANVGVTPQFGSNANALLVTVPDTIPNAPASPGQQLNVQVRVEANGLSGTLDHIILPEMVTDRPSIRSIDLPNDQTFARINQNIVIHGINFGTNISQVTVHFGEINNATARPIAVSSTQLTVTVPDIPQLRGAQDRVTLQVRVEFPAGVFSQEQETRQFRSAN